MQPILFLQSGDTGTIKRISGAEEDFLQVLALLRTRK